MKNEAIPTENAENKAQNVNAEKKHGETKNDKKTGIDPTYAAQQERNDRTANPRHQGDSQMNDENRSGGSGI